MAPIEANVETDPKTSATWEVTLTALQQELEEVKEHISRHQERARRLEAAIRSLKQLWTDDSVTVQVSGFPVDPFSGRVVSTPLSAPTSVQSSAPPGGSFSAFRVFGSEPPSFGRAAEIVLRESRQPLHVKSIIAAIHTKGWYTERSAEQVRTSLVPTLNRKAAKGDTFFKVENKPVYGLVSWKQAESR